MNLEVYLQQVREIHVQMKSIAEQTAKMAISGNGDMSNPNFAAAMTKFNQLLTDLIALDCQYSGNKS